MRAIRIVRPFSGTLFARTFPSGRLIEQLLVKIRITGTTDSQRNIGLLLQLTHVLEESPDETCTIYRMSPSNSRQRKVNEDGEVSNLFQGEFPVQPRERRGEDLSWRSRTSMMMDTVTIQIRELELTHKKQVVARNVPVLAVWVPSRLAHDWIAQEHQP